jgi:predicted nucleic acid-binding protein
MIFLDTDILSYFLRGDDAIINKISQVIEHGEEIGLTTMSVYEILKGFRYRNNKKKETLFLEMLDNLSVFSLDNTAINIAADIYASLRKSGQTISDADIIIAAIVMSNNGILVTNNNKHFINIKNLKFENRVC